MVKVEQSPRIVELIKCAVFNSISKERDEMAGVSGDPESTNYCIYDIYSKSI